MPGELRALEHLHKSYGSLPWYDLFAPSIKLAREGFAVSEDLFRYMAAVTPSNSFLSQDPTWAMDFAPNGTLLGIGDRMLRKRYADTLEVIAVKGPNAFYEGAMAGTTIDTIRKAQGIMTLSDLAGFNITIRKPVTTEYREFKLISVPAPASGAVVLQTFSVFEGYGGFPETNLNLSLHRLDEVIKFGYGEVSSPQSQSNDK